MNTREKANRVIEVVKVRKKLRELHLDGCNFEGIEKLKEVLTQYVNLDETRDAKVVLRGDIEFEEYDKVIQYVLPMTYNTDVMVRIVKK